MRMVISDPTSPILLSHTELDQLIELGYVIRNDSLPEQLARDLYEAACHSQGFQQAGLTQGIRNSGIRRDHIRWLNEESEPDSHYLQVLEQLSLQLNQSLYCGIRRIEAHYSQYQDGGFYQWHQDNPAGRNERVFSTVLYLNPHWNAEHGGQLEFVPLTASGAQASLSIEPIWNRLIIFNSDCQHRVLPALHPRTAIAGWLRSDEMI
jgi:SM-20-related protein